MRRLLLAVVAMGVVFSVSLFVAPANLPPVEASSGSPDKIEMLGAPGPYAAGFTSFVATDESRPGVGGYSGRPIPVSVWYPVDQSSITPGAAEAVYPIDMVFQPALTSPSSEWEAMGHDRAFQEPVASGDGPFPLVVVSPGWVGGGWFHTSLATRLASHGFVVAVASHAADPWFSTWPPYDHYARAMWNRPRDISFVLTSLLERNAAPGDLFEGVIDPDLVAAAGHSAGGYATIALASGDDTVWDYGLTDQYALYDGPIPEDVPDGPTPPDPRIKAFVLLDAANQELRLAEMARLTAPVLALGQEWDVLAAAGVMGPSWQARQHAAFSGRPSYRVDIAGTNHYSFSDWCDVLKVMDRLGLQSLYGTNDEVRAWSCEGVIPPVEGHAIITRYMLAFLKTQLLGETGYQRMLTPGWALTRETGIEFFETEKRSPRSILGEWPDVSVYFWHQPGIQHSQANKNAKHNLASRFIPRFR